MATPTPPPGGFQNGGWYNGQQYWNGSFSAPGVIANPNQQGAGQAVSKEVVAQTNPNNNAYIASQQANPVNPVAAPAPAAPTNSGGVPGSTGASGGASVGSIGSAPTFDLQAATTAAYNTPEITAANKAIDDANAQITARQQALATAQAGINDNPFYSEATRVGKSQKLTQEANNDMTVLQKQVTDAQGKVDSLRADAAIKVNAAKGQYDINEQAYKDNLSQFNTLLSNGALDNASGTDIANLAITTGIPTSMIQSMVSASQKKNNPTQLVQATDNQGNLTLLAVDKNGTVVNQTTIPGVEKQTKVTGGSSAADTKAADLQTTKDNAAKAAKAGAQLKELVDHYGQALSVDDIYSIYNSNSKTPAKESVESVKEGRYANVANSGWQPAVKP